MSPQEIDGLPSQSCGAQDPTRAAPKALPSAAHTPGPWVYYADLPSAEPDWHIVTTANRLRVLANVHIEPGNKGDEANARLIAAAPGMFEAIRAAHAILKAGKPPFSPREVNARTILRDAIRAATTPTSGEAQ